MYEAFTKFKNEYGYKDLKEELDGLTMEKLLGSLKKAVVDSTADKEAVDSTVDKDALPEWVKSGDQTCTVRAAIADALKLCPSQAKKAADEKKKKEAEKAKAENNRKPDPTVGRQPCDNFDLGSEGCWKARGSLPVYGARFFDLYEARRKQQEQQKAGTKEEGVDGYWKLFMEGLEKQEKKPGKGCNPAAADNFPKDGKPGKHIKKAKDAIAMYEIGEGDAKKNGEVKTPEIFTFEQWSKTAFWDTLLIDLTALSVKFIRAIDKEHGGDEKLTLAVEEGGKLNYKAVQYIDNKVAATKIEEIVTGAKQYLKPDVLFAQELEVKDKEGETEYTSQRAAEDTAIYVRTDFGGGIDKEASVKLQWLWDGMMGGINGAFEMERNKIMAQSLGGAGKLKELDSSKEPAAKKKLAEEYKAAGAKIPYTSIPAQQLPTWDDGTDEASTEGMKKRIEIQQAGFANAAAEKGLVYATKLQLVTVAMTAQDPKVMLLSIHADSDGYYCAQYLNLAKKFYDTISKDHKLTAMYIGMDANVQPPHGHPSWDNKKGFTFMQLRRALPEKMAMVDPKLSTVKKVRTFLQTQFAKIGKDDEERKDLLFVYPYVSEDHTKTKVYNVFDGKAFSFVGDERARDDSGRRIDPPEEKKKDADDGKEPKKKDPSVYYPTNAWPVDHFMSYAAVTIDGEAGPAPRKLCDVVKTGLRAANPFKKIAANLLVRVLVKGALAELKKPEPEKAEEKKEEKPKEEKNPKAGA